MFSRENRRQEEAKSKHIFEKVVHVVGLVLHVVPTFWRAHWVQVIRNSCYFADVSKNGQNPLLLVAFLLCSRCVALEMCLYSHFKGVFGVVCVFGVGLCCLGALRGFVRVWS